MTAYEAHEHLVAQCQYHGTHVPLCIAVMEPTGDGQNLEEVYHEVESVDSIVTPYGKRFIVLRT